MAPSLLLAVFTPQKITLALSASYVSSNMTTRDSSNGCVSLRSVGTTQYKSTDSLILLPRINELLIIIITNAQIRPE